MERKTRSNNELGGHGVGRDGHCGYRCCGIQQLRLVNYCRSSECYISAELIRHKFFSISPPVGFISQLTGVPAISQNGTPDGGGGGADTLVTVIKSFTGIAPPPLQSREFSISTSHSTEPSIAADPHNATHAVVEFNELFNTLLEPAVTEVSTD